MSVSIRVAALGVIVLLWALTGCRHANITQLPKDWPLKRLGLPEGSAVFEGHVNADVELADGAKARQWTVFFTCEQSYPEVVSSMEEELMPLNFLKRHEEPQAVPVGGGPITFSTAYCTEDGSYLAFILYEESAESRSNIGGGFFTLMLQSNEPPLPPTDDYQPIR